MTKRAHNDAEREKNPKVGVGEYQRVVEEARRYQHGPHFSPTLVGPGSGERQSFEVSTASLNIHERMSTRAIAEAAKRLEKQLSGFGGAQIPMDKRVEVHEHEMNWVKSLILGDSLLVAKSLLQREGIAGKVQMIYVDPLYGISYSSNFQPTVRHRDVEDGQDTSLTPKVMQMKTFRDIWALGMPRPFEVVRIAPPREDANVHSCEQHGTSIRMFAAGI